MISTNIKINELANKLAVENLRESEKQFLFSELYQAIEPKFDSMVRAYMVKNNLIDFNFDKTDYISAIGQAMMDAVKQYDMTKGDFMPRLTVFARKRMSNVTEYNLAEKRFDKSKQTYSYEELHESAEFDIEDFRYSEDAMEVFKAINDFIKTDKEGELIKILYLVTSQSARRQAFEWYFGGAYGSAERKRVQRVRQRLQQHLKNNGVFI